MKFQVTTTSPIQRGELFYVYGVAYNKEAGIYSLLRRSDTKDNIWELNGPPIYGVLDADFKKYYEKWIYSAKQLDPKVKFAKCILSDISARLPGVPGNPKSP